MAYLYDDEDNAPMNDDAVRPSHKRECHKRCRYNRFCYLEGADRDDFPDECAQYYHIEDILADAEDIRIEQWKARGEDDDGNPYPPEEVDDECDES